MVHDLLGAGLVFGGGLLIESAVESAVERVVERVIRNGTQMASELSLEFLFEVVRKQVPSINKQQFTTTLKNLSSISYDEVRTR